MYEIDRQMLLIKSLDSGAALEFSEYTHQWFVMAQLHEGGDGSLRGSTEHRETPDLAVEAYFDFLCEHTLVSDHYIVSDAYGERRHWYWNGVTFVLHPKQPAKR
jgi:hypothetical protein